MICRGDCKQDPVPALHHSWEESVAGDERWHCLGCLHAAQKAQLQPQLEHDTSCHRNTGMSLCLVQGKGSQGKFKSRSRTA